MRRRTRSRPRAAVRAAGSTRRPSARRPSARASASRARKQSPLLYGAIGLCGVVIVAVVLILLNGGNRTSADTAAPSEPGMPNAPTEREMDEARALYRTAKDLANRADRILSDGTRAEAERLYDDANEKIERALAIWREMMERTPEQDRDNYLRYEEREVRHWNLLKRRLFRPNH